EALAYAQRQFALARETNVERWIIAARQTLAEIKDHSRGTSKGKIPQASEAVAPHPEAEDPVALVPHDPAEGDVVVPHDPYSSAYNVTRTVLTTSVSGARQSTDDLVNQQLPSGKSKKKKKQKK